MRPQIMPDENVKNKGGRPKGSTTKTLSDMLRKALKETVEVQDKPGSIVTKKKEELIATFIIQALVEGRISFPGVNEDGTPRVIIIDVKTWTDLFKFMMNRIEGTAPTGSEPEPDNNEEETTPIEKIRDLRWLEALPQLGEALSEESGIEQEQIDDGADLNDDKPTQ